MTNRFKFYTAIQLIKAIFAFGSFIIWGVLLIYGYKVKVFDSTLKNVITEFDWVFIFLNFFVSLLSLIIINQYFWLKIDFDFYKESTQQKIYELQKRLEIYEPKEEEEEDFDD